MYVCMYVCIYVCMYVCVYNLYIPVPISTTNMLALRPIQNAVGARFCKENVPQTPNFCR